MKKQENEKLYWENYWKKENRKEEKITLTGDDLSVFNKLVNMLDEVEDVQNVYHNVDLD